MSLPALAARRIAEVHVGPILDWPEDWIALALYFLQKAGWTMTKAEAHLRKRGWWLEDQKGVS